MGCSNNWCIFLIIILLLCDTGCGCNNGVARASDCGWFVRPLKSKKKTALPNARRSKLMRFLKKVRQLCCPFCRGSERQSRARTQSWLRCDAERSFSP